MSPPAELEQPCHQRLGEQDASVVEAQVLRHAHCSRALRNSKLGVPGPTSNGVSGN